MQEMYIAICYVVPKEPLELIIIALAAFWVFEKLKKRILCQSKQVIFIENFHIQNKCIRSFLSVSMQSDRHKKGPKSNKSCSIWDVERYNWIWSPKADVDIELVEFEPQTIYDATDKKTKSRFWPGFRALTWRLLRPTRS